jgi:hypothetical protein
MTYKEFEIEWGTPRCVEWDQASDWILILHPPAWQNSRICNSEVDAETLVPVEHTKSSRAGYRHD